MRADLDAVRHPSDGGGRATWVGPPPAATVGTPVRLVLDFEVGAQGIAEGGAIYLQSSPFWGWSTPQVTRPEAPGYTTVSASTAAADDRLRLEPATVDRQLLAVRVLGRALDPGERLRFVFGAGPLGVAVDQYAELGERLWLAVDGDGDGVRQLLADPPSIDVAPGPLARLVLVGPSTGRPDEPLTLRLSLLAANGDADLWAPVDGPSRGTVRIEVLGSAVAPSAPAASADSRVELDGRGLATVSIVPWAPAGVLRVRAVGEGALEGLEAESNPIQVAAAARPILWGDLQVHSNDSDGTGRAVDLFRYGREVAALDVMAVTDHDHWGLRFLDQSPALWGQLQGAATAAHDEGRFVALRGYEWTSWVHGHRHVLFFDDAPAEIASSVDPATDHPDELWAILAGRRALTLAHHSAGQPVSTDWSIPPDPRLETVTEIVSVHGSSEAADTPRRIQGAIVGNFVRDALRRGYRLGFLGSSDSHDGHPGLAHLNSGVSGLAAILADEPTRDGVYRALRARQVYATSGPRIVLRALLAGWPMGSELVVDGGAVAGLVPPEHGVETADGPVPGIPADHLFVQALGTEEIERIDLVTAAGATRIDRSLLACEDEGRACRTLLPVPLEAGGFLYVRVVQVDGHAAWSSPFFLSGSKASG